LLALPADVSSAEIVAQQSALRDWSASCVKKREGVEEIGRRIKVLDGVRAQIAADCTTLEAAQQKNLDVTRRCLGLIRK
jgi:hypothetical protein